MREDLEHNFDLAEFNNSCRVMKCARQLFPHSEKQAQCGLFIATKDGLGARVELLSNNVIEGIQIGNNLSNYTKKGEKLNLFTTKNGTSNNR